MPVRLLAQHELTAPIYAVLVVKARRARERERKRVRGREGERARERERTHRRSRVDTTPLLWTRKRSREWESEREREWERGSERERESEPIVRRLWTRHDRERERERERKRERERAREGTSILRGCRSENNYLLCVSMRRECEPFRSLDPVDSSHLCCLCCEDTKSARARERVRQRAKESESKRGRVCEVRERDKNRETENHRRTGGHDFYNIAVDSREIVKILGPATKDRQTKTREGRQSVFVNT